MISHCAYYQLNQCKLGFNIKSQIYLCSSLLFTETPPTEKLNNIASEILFFFLSFSQLHIPKKPLHSLFYLGIAATIMATDFEFPYKTTLMSFFEISSTLNKWLGHSSPISSFHAVDASNNFVTFVA